MSDPTRSLNPEPNTELLNLLERWQSLRDQGQTPNIEELCPDPARREELARHIQNLERFDPLMTADHNNPPPHHQVIAIPEIPGYTDLEEIARGGMGVVYKARQVRLNRIVALKLVLSHHAADPRQLVRFVAEAEAVAAIDHPNVIRIYDTGSVNGCPYIAMEHLPNGTLADRIKKKGAMPPREAVELIRKIALGVQAAHDNQIVHRDLKPANVLFDINGEPKVTDFGLAKKAGGSDLTATNAIMGTAAYMATEQAKGESKYVGPQADVWALGVMLYETLSGKRPFTGSNEIEILRKVVEEEPSSLRSVSRSIPRDLELIAQKCLSKELHGRYDSVTALCDDFERWLVGKPVSVKESSRADRIIKWTRRNKLAASIMSGAVAAMLAFAGISIWAIGESRRAENNAVIAQDNAREAQKQTQEAEIQTEHSKRLEKEARNITALAKQESHRALRQLDLARLIDAQYTFQHGNPRHAIAKLTEIREENRCIAYQYLNHLMNDYIAKYDFENFEPSVVKWSPRGDEIAIGGKTGVISILNPRNGTRRELRKHHAGAVLAMAWSENGETLLSGGMDNQILIYNAATGILTQSIAQNSPITTLDIVGQRQFLSGTLWGINRIWEQVDGKSDFRMSNVLNLEMMLPPMRKEGPSPDSKTPEPMSKPNTRPRKENSSMPDDLSGGCDEDEQQVAFFQQPPPVPQPPPMMPLDLGDPYGVEYPQSPGDLRSLGSNTASNNLSGAPTGIAQNQGAPTASGRVAAVPAVSITNSVSGTGGIAGSAVNASDFLARPIHAIGSVKPARRFLIELDRNLHFLVHQNDSIEIIDRTTKKAISTIPIQRSDPVAMSLCRHRGLLAISTPAHILICDAIKVATPLKTIETPNVVKIKWSRDGNYLATLTSDGIINVYHVYINTYHVNTSLRQIAQCVCIEAPVIDFDWSPDSSLIFGITSQNKAYVWALERDGPRSLEQVIKSFDWDHQQETLYACNDKHVVVEWSEYGPVTASKTLTNSPTAIRSALCMENKTLALVDTDGTIRLVNTADHKEIGTITSTIPSPISTIEWSKNGEELFVGYDNSSTEVWNTESRQLVAHRKDHVRGIMSLPMPTLNNGMRVMDSVTRDFGSAVNKILKCPTGGKYASCGMDGHICIWQSNESMPMVRRQCHRGPALCLSWSPDGKSLVSGGGDGTIALLDACDGKILRQLHSYANRVNSVDWSHDGRRIISGHDDGRVCIWDAESMQILMRIPMNCEIAAVSFSPTDTSFAVLSTQGTLRKLTGHNRTDGPNSSFSAFSDNREWHLSQVYISKMNNNDFGEVLHLQQLAKLGPLDKSSQYRLSYLEVEIGCRETAPPPRKVAP